MDELKGRFPSLIDVIVGNVIICRLMTTSGELQLLEDWINKNCKDLKAKINFTNWTIEVTKTK